MASRELAEIEDKLRVEGTTMTIFFSALDLEVTQFSESGHNNVDRRAPRR